MLSLSITSLFQESLTELPGANGGLGIFKYSKRFAGEPQHWLGQLFDSVWGSATLRKRCEKAINFMSKKMDEHFAIDLDISNIRKKTLSLRVHWKYARKTRLRNASAFGWSAVHS